MSFNELTHNFLAVHLLKHENMDRTGSEIGEQQGENPQKTHNYKQVIPRPAKRKWTPQLTAYEIALKKELEKAHKEYTKLEARLQWVSDKLKVSRAMNEQKKQRIEQIKHLVSKKGRPRTKPDPTLVKLSEVERVMALRVVHQYRQAANKELYLTKLKFAIGIDPLTDFAAPDSKGGA